jgi:hypothetical protein
VADVASPHHLRLEHLKGWYDRVRGGRRVFLIAGRVVNTAAAKAVAVRVEGTIFDGSGREVGRKVIYCGNGVSPSLVRSLSTSELDLLQDLVPPARFALSPHKPVDFIVIFVDPPAGIKEFSARVSAARFAKPDDEA